MTLAEISSALANRHCMIVEDRGRFALVHPCAFEKTARSHDLLATIKRVVAADFGVGVVDIDTSDRTEPLATARRVAIAPARERTWLTCEAIGAAFARNHSTVINSARQVADQCATDRRFAARVGTLRVASSAAMRTDGEGV